MTIYAISGPFGSTIQPFAQELAIFCGEENVVIIDASKYMQSNYSLDTYNLKKEILQVCSKDLIVFGELIFAEEELREIFTHKIYVQTDLDICLSNYLKKIILNTDLENVLDGYETKMKPLNEKIIDVCKKNADFIIPEYSNDSIVFKVLASASSKQRALLVNESNEKGSGYGFFN